MNKRDFKILVVDDDDIAREVVGSILSKEGYAVLTAVDGLQAISALMTEEIGMVITDFKMPGADGFEVLRTSVRANPETSVVIITAYGTLEATLEAIAEGAYDYLTKPFKIQEIIIVADRAFKRARLLAENRELKEHLRETYRDLKILKAVSSGDNPCLVTEWIERLEKLKSDNILSLAEAEILKERLLRGNGVQDTDSR
ncbi:MAG: response regulator [Nitrospiraceae bacterium]|nr:response regulator [Nitrospiraceae bacterium]MDA8324816.1 response regulator [Nitrospiraceae bacterium]